MEHFSANAAMRSRIAVSRRTFIKGTVTGSIAAATNLTVFPANANPLTATPPAVKTTGVLSGTEFHLDIVLAEVNYSGQPRIATTVNGMLPSPTLIWREGDEVTLHVTNHLDEDSSIHWHGIILPFEMDGVPGLTYAGIKPGETFTYRFKVQQHGTYWYHSHSGFQEQTGMYGAIVILPKQEDPYDYQRDYVIQLSDWSDEHPDDIVHNLKKMPSYYNYQQRTLGEFFDEVKAMGFWNAFNARKMWNEMRMSDRDISDVSGATYTYLMSGINPSTQWRGLFKPGETVRLRFINSAAMTFFDVRIPGLKMTVIAADGNLIQPVEIDEFRLGVAETYDVLVTPEHDSAYAIFAQAIDRSGYALGSLTPRLEEGVQAPEMDPAPILSHADMGMGMMHHGHHSMENMDDMAFDNMAMQPADQEVMDHSQHTMPNMQMDMPATDDSMSAMDHASHSEMDHSQHTMAAEPSMEHAHQMDMDGYAGMNMSVPDANLLPQNWPVEEPQVDWGPQVDMRADNPQYRLDDPGVGLRDNGRRVLTYADLRNLHSTRSAPQPDREIVLHLTGNMERYVWSINGIPYSKADPIHLQYGERVRITFINDTMMNHPMHLHGMWSDLETGDLNFLPRKHTVIVQPGAKISYRVTVDAKGVWAYHCHMLYHMSGMFRKVIVA